MADRLLAANNRADVIAQHVGHDVAARHGRNHAPAFPLTIRHIVACRIIRPANGSFARMGTGVAFYIRNLVGQEMRSRIALARKRGETLVIPETAAEIARSYPGSALADEDLRNRLFAEAIRAGAPVALKANTRH